MKSVAYCTAHVPVEWIAAHGLQPQRLNLRTADTSSTAAGLRGVCPFAGALVDTAGDLEADALVVATTCDQMRRAVTLAQRNGRLPILAIHVPATWQTDTARSYYRDELGRLSRFLVQLGGVVPTDDQLAHAIAGSRAAEKGGQSPFAGTARRVLRTNGDCPPFSGQIAVDDPTADGVRLALVGGPLLEKDRVLYDWLEQAGGRVVLDASEGGRRTQPCWPESDRVRREPIEALIDAYFLGIPDAFRRPNDLLYQWLGRELSARQVRGIVFHRYVWCDIWHGELYRLRQWSPVPVLDLDAGDDQPCVQSRTLGRLEAFLEMLR